MYAVVRNTTYYTGDCQHPSGYSLTLATVGYTDKNCIGTLAECQDWADTLNTNAVCDHGEVTIDYQIVRIDDENADYQSWLDCCVDWKGCPDPSGEDYDANCAWAEDQAYNYDGIMPIAGPNGGLMLINLDIDS